MPLMALMRQRIFEPLKLTTIADFDAGPLKQEDAAPYLRNAIGPLRLAPKEGPGWLFGAGQLAMTAHDLALWNIAVMNQSVLKSTSYEVYPEEKAAIVVFTNIYPGAAGAPDQIAGRIASVLFAESDEATMKARDLARRIYDGLAKGTIDRSLFSADANAYFTAEVLADYAASLGPLGAPSEFAQTGESLRGGMTIRSYRIRARNRAMDLTTMTWPNGKIDQYLIARAS